MATIPEALALAVQHHQAGQLQAAEQIYRQILAVDPDNPDVLQLLGVIASQMGRHKIAIEHFRRALKSKPDYAEAHCNLGKAFHDQAKLDEAIACFHRALELKPDLPEAHSSLGIAFQAQGKLNEAVVCFHRALELKPDYAEAHNDLGDVLQAQGKLNEAVTCFRQALELKPDLPEAHNNLGTACRSHGNYEEAASHYRKALDLKPEYAEPHCNGSMIMLVHGDFENGWREYEWRWKTKTAARRLFSQPVWDGKPLADRTILLHAEQGFGDTIQFVRYAALVKKQNPLATVNVECQRPLANLLARCPGIDRLIAEGDDLSPFDVHSPLLSLPRIFKTTVETIPANIPYLFADSTLVAHWHERLNHVNGFRIGINWRGRPGQGDFRKRDITLDYFAALAQVPGVHLISLQRRTADERQTDAADHPWLYDPGHDVDITHGPFMDTAAIMKNLDLVITSDTSIPHLAGALGVPVWLALPYVPDWRWLLDRSDSPWYPTMRLFRQKSPGNWPSVFQEIQSALRSR